LLGKGPDGIFNNREVGKVCTMHGFICCGNIQNDADVKKFAGKLWIILLKWNFPI